MHLASWPRDVSSFGGANRELRQLAYEARERIRVTRLHQWARHAVPARSSEGSKRVGLLAGYGNTSYGDYFIGLGLAAAVHSAGHVPVILGRGSVMDAFAVAGIETADIGDRLDELESFDDQLSRLNGLILGGGGLFEDRTDHVLSQSLAAGYLARALRACNSGIPVAVYGVGLCGEWAFGEVRRMLAEMLRKADYVAVRDETSARAARGLGATATTVVDPAAIELYANAVTLSVGTEDRTAFIPFARRAWPHLDNPTPSAHALQDLDWVEAARRIRSRNARQVTIVPFHSSDLSFTERISEILGGVVSEVVIAPFTPTRPHDVLTTLSGCGHALTMRYHGFMASHFAGIRNIDVIGESQKLKATLALQSSGQLASTWSGLLAERQVHAALAAMFSA